MDVDAHRKNLLLPFQRHLLSLLVPPPDAQREAGDLLLILARGLGLRSIVATLVCSRPAPLSALQTDLSCRRVLGKQLKIYQSPEQLVLVVNATPEEERGLSEEVGMRLKVVGYEMSATAR